MKLSEDRRQTLLLMCTGALSGAVVLDESILGVALPRIEEDLGLSFLTSHWILNAYFLTLTCFVAVGGKSVDMFGLRQLLIFGGAVFTAASLIAGFADSGALLIAMRILQGIGGALLFAIAQTGANLSLTPERRGRGIAIYGTVVGILMVLGPVLSGLLTHYLSWRWVFWADIPIILLVAAAMILLWKPKGDAPKSTVIDWGGMFLLLFGLFGVVFAFLQGTSLGWTNNIILFSGMAGAGALYLFDYYERRHAHPLLDVRLLRRYTFILPMGIYFLAQYALIGYLAFFPMFLQTEMGYSARDSGLSMIPVILPFVLLGIPAGHLADRFGSRKVVACGTGLSVIGTGGLILVLSTQNHLLITALIMVWCSGAVFTLAPARRIAVAATPRNKMGQATGTMLTLRLLGTTIGVTGSSVALNASGYPAVFVLIGLVLVIAFVITLLFLQEPRISGSTKNA
ncbi:MFS transporter [Roseibium sp. RKSG952]|uniref:MFS transporter n=1 Tax=Roseibium sp. RKSG952 TaxID=2529384 RepID=UPI0012BCE54F|nr:MFS transporter [Roseibium sp. RKSG952]MTH97271.1 MFS transporter [Roseibium sp. RKSG952]